MAKRLFLVKLGGGLIAPKDGKMETADLPTIKRLAEEIRNAREKTGCRLVIAAGSGNYGHAAVKKWGMDTVMAQARVQFTAQKIGAIVTAELLEKDMPAVLVSPHDMWVVNKGKLAGNNAGIIKSFLDRGLVPVVYGDVIWDEVEGAVIFSGEKCLKFIARELAERGDKPEKIIQVSIENGVLDGKGEVIPRIDPGSWEIYKKEMRAAPAVDVTGGMRHKIEESLEMAQKSGISSVIICGKTEGNLEKAMSGEVVTGTEIV